MRTVNLPGIGVMFAYRQIKWIGNVSHPTQMPSLPFPNIDIQFAVIDIIACTSICEQHVCIYCNPWSVTGFIIDWIVQTIN